VESVSTKYLFPVQIMGALLRGKMMHALARATRWRRLQRRPIFCAIHKASTA